MSMQPSASLWVTLCEDLQKERNKTRREEYVRVAEDFVASAGRMLRADSPKLADANEIAGDICQEAGALEEAKSHFEKALEIAEQASSHSQSGRVAGKLADLLAGSGEAARARDAYRRAIRNYDLAEDHTWHGVLFSGLAAAHRSTGEFDLASKAYRDGIEVIVQLQGPQNPDLAVLNNNLGVLLTESGDLRGAEEAHMQALALREKIFGANHPEVAHSLANLGVVNHQRGDTVTAAKDFRAALEIYRHFRSPDDPDLREMERYINEAENR